MIPTEDLKSFREGGCHLPSRELPLISFTLSDEVFVLLSELISRTSGIKLGPRKKALVISRLGRRLKALGMKGFYDYYQRVKRDHGELIEMINCISTNTTQFFREEYHFEYLKNILMPERIKERSRPAMRIWSAGCATGEEPYSIALSLCEALKRLNEPRERWDIRILATDISTDVLKRAEAGIYEYDQLPDDTPQEMLNRYFLRGVGEQGGKIRVKDMLKEMIRFRRFNLKETIYPFAKHFDIIFCRNVMIYFDEDMKRHVITQFHRHLFDHGYLFLGHSETMLGKERFVPVSVTVYRKQ